MATKITLFILDDNIYKSQEFVEKSIYDSKIDSKLLSELIEKYEWKGQHNLQELASEVLKSKHSQSGEITTYGFTHPSICLDEIDNGLKPDVVIFDWEYGSESNKESSNWLMEILNSTNAFIFVYSMVRNEIPPFLNKQEFDKYANRFQLFLKGEQEGEKNSIFTSEEFILQYILSRASKTNRIKIQNNYIDFKENGYLQSPSDILYIERILGRANLLTLIKNKVISDISDTSVEAILANINDKILYDETRKVLVLSDYEILSDKIKEYETLSALEVLKKFGLKQLQDVLETGIANAK